MTEPRPRSGEALLEAVELMDRLRRTGPWEAAQTHDSLRRYLLEETYELLDAIEGGSRADLLEELADILLQVLFHARIAADDPTEPFDIDDVARAFTAKISSRTAGVLAGRPTWRRNCVNGRRARPPRRPATPCWTAWRCRNRRWR